MKVVSIKCPECGAMLQIEEGNKQTTCSYCGAKVLLENENEYVYHHIDEAEVSQAETDRMVRMRQLEVVEKQQKADQKMRVVKIIASLLLTVGGVMLIVIGHMVGLLLLIAAVCIRPFKRKKIKMKVTRGKDKSSFESIKF